MTRIGDYVESFRGQREKKPRIARPQSATPSKPQDPRNSKHHDTFIMTICNRTMELSRNLIDELIRSKASLTTKSAYAPLVAKFFGQLLVSDACDHIRTAHRELLAKTGGKEVLNEILSGKLTPVTLHSLPENLRILFIFHRIAQLRDLMVDNMRSLLFAEQVATFIGRHLPEERDEITMLLSLRPSDLRKIFTGYLTEIQVQALLDGIDLMHNVRWFPSRNNV